MQQTSALQVKDMVLAPPPAATIQNVTGPLAPTTRKIYTIDATHFVQWMVGQDLSLFLLGRDELIAYRRYLAKQYAKTIALRMWAVARRLLAHNPVEGIRGFQTGDESLHRALKREEAKGLLGAVDRRTTLGKRHYALIMLLLRTGIYRAEARVLTIGDLVKVGQILPSCRMGRGIKILVRQDGIKSGEITSIKMLWTSFG